jgi:hypothetical protein
MGEKSSGPGPARPGGAGDDEVTQNFVERDWVIRTRPTEPANPPPHPPTEVTPSHTPTEVAEPYRTTEVAQPYQPTEVAQPYQPTEVAQPYQPTEVAQPYQPTAVAQPYQPTEVARPYRPTDGAPSRQPTDVVRYGPGVPDAPPASQAGLTAERVWRTGRLAEPPRRPRRLRRLLGSALTVILLAASGVVLYLRFHHAPFHVTDVRISRQTPTTCGVDVTGQITTNGAAGTVSYQWLFRPGRQQPQPLNQSVISGQHAVYVTVAVEGSGHGSASQTVILQILGPDPRAASTAMTISC